MKVTMILSQVVYILSITLCLSGATYLTALHSDSGKDTRKSLQKRRDHRPPEKRYRGFKSDKDILHYLKLFGTDVMIWRCKNVIQPFWDWKPIPVVELHCETLGVLQEVEWFHNRKKIDTENDERYSQVISAHYAFGQYYSAWLDFRLKIFNATTEDSGMYTFSATSAKAFNKQRDMYVDISKKKKKRYKFRKTRWLRHTGTSPDFERFYIFHRHQRERGKNKYGVNESRVKTVKTGKNTYYTIR